MNQGKRDDGSPAKTLLDQCGYVGKLVLIRERGEASRPDNGVEFCLSSFLDLWKRGHGDVEGLERRERL